jgi:radical SAM superfamily enzyme YgiQ (UPF0313 family)
LFLRPHITFRPPAEADSVIICIATGCPWNACTFCAMYKGVRYQALALDDCRRAIRRAARRQPDAARVFLADGDVMALPFATLQAVLDELNSAFPRLARVSVYANGHSINAKTDVELRALQARKLHTLYMGLESGSDEVLRAVCKRELAAEMIAAGQRAQATGLRMSVMVLIGLAGRAGSMAHARATVAALNQMQPRLLSALRYIPIRGTPLYDTMIAGGQMLTEYEAVGELRALLADLQLERTVFRADHSSNIVPLRGRLPADKQSMLALLDELCAGGLLDRTSPGALPTML